MVAKQWPAPSSSMVSFLSSVAVTDFWRQRVRAGHGGHEGLVVQRAMASPVSGKGSARMAQSISPVRSISSSLTVKFSCSISGICGVRVMALRTSSGSR
jgi:hypothetical protein